MDDRLRDKSIKCQKVAPNVARPRRAEHLSDDALHGDFP